jgi:hypothetical protein
MKSRIAVIVGAGLLVAATTFAQRPKETVSSQRHPNLAAAQRLVDQAFNRITEAQKANEFDLGGHAAKAKALLDDANKELKLAAEAANKR